MNQRDEHNQRRQQRFLRQVARRAAADLAEVRNHRNSPQGLEYFLRVLERVYVENRLPPSMEDQTLIGTYCIMVPEELVYAAGAAPVRLCGGCFESAQLGEEYVPRDGCPVVKSSLGFAMQEAFQAAGGCRAMIVPTTCDGKRKLGEELSGFGEVWMLEVPHIKDAEYGRRLWQEQVQALKHKLERLGNNGRRKIKAKGLAKAMAAIAGAQHEVRRLQALRRLDRPVVGGLATTLVMNAYAFDHVESWTRALGELNRELEVKRDDKVGLWPQKAPRVMLAGSPVIFPTVKIPSIIEQMGGVVVCDESCAGDRYLYDPVGFTDTSLGEQMTGIASRYLMPCICPSFAPNSERLIRLAQMAEEFQVDGIIHHVLKGCIIYDFEIHRVERIMKEKGIPLLRVETDYNPEDVEQLRTRIEAFVEMLKEKNESRQWS